MRQRLLAPEPSPPLVFLDMADMPWEGSTFPGVRSETFYSDPSGMCIEQTYVIENCFVDEEGEWRPEGNTHVAWAGPEGALILGIFLRPNVFAAGQKFFTAEE